MEDLRALNKRILAAMATPNANLSLILDLLSVCVGRLKLSGAQISGALSDLSNCTGTNSLEITSINREYLLFARQTARDILNGRFVGVVILNINFSQARALASLSNQQIGELAHRYDGFVFDVVVAARCQVGPLHTKAVPHYSAALLATVA